MHQFQMYRLLKKLARHQPGSNDLRDSLGHTEIQWSLIGFLIPHKKPWPPNSLSAHPTWLLPTLQYLPLDSTALISPNLHLAQPFGLTINPDY